MKKMITICIVLVVISSSIFSYTDPTPIEFNLKFLNSGETDFDFAAYNTYSSPGSIDSIAFTFYSDENNDAQNAKAQFGVWWEIFAEETAVNATLSLSFSAAQDGSKNYMLEHESNTNIVLNYSSAVDAFLDIDGQENTELDKSGKGIVVPESSIASNSFANRSFDLFSNHAIDSFEVFSGFANITLTLEPPYYDEETQSRYFMNGVYVGYAILSLTTN